MRTKLRSVLAIAFTGFCLVAGSVPGSAAEVKEYGLKTCLVSGNELGSMGAPIRKVYDGQEIIFCCKPCIKKFEANPTKYLSKLPGKA